MFGFRPEGRALRGKIDPIMRLTPHIMVERSDSQCYSTQYVDSEIISEYLQKKRREGHKISAMALILAAYVRTVSQFPALNRFIVGRTVYARNELCVSFAIIKLKSKTDFLETTVKLYFHPSDTLFDVAQKVEKAIAENRSVESQNSTDKVAKALFAVPGLVRLGVAILKGLDRIGCMPRVVLDASPFHTSMFITNMGSINMNETHHHLYNFGTTTVFLGLGKREHRLKISRDGSVATRRYYPIATTIDERVAPGAMFSMAFDLFQSLLRHPDRLESPPETVFLDGGVVIRKRDEKK